MMMIKAFRPPHNLPSSHLPPPRMIASKLASRLLKGPQTPKMNHDFRLVQLDKYPTSYVDPYRSFSRYQTGRIHP